jgi:NAD(P)-dependent dehydrogenase (short-subunit alcohol dehydrogenase family)
MSYAIRDMSGKVCLVSGATSGIGRMVALQLAQQGAGVIVASRRERKCAQTVKWIVAKTANSEVDYAPVDLADQVDIHRFARSIHERYSGLDVLINNAGGFFFTRRENAAGLEMTYALNHLGYFTTTLMLLDLLERNSPARIINVASTSHRNASIHFDNLQLERRYRPFKAYGQSKLANLLFTYELAKRLDATRVTVNALHPGFIGTNLTSDNGLLGLLAGPLMRLAGRSPEQGAQTPVYLATATEVEALTGKYFVDCEPVASAPQSYDEEAGRRLWDISLAQTGLEDPT